MSSRIGTALLLLVMSTSVLANDTEELNDLYRIFSGPGADVSAIAASYGNDIVADGVADEPLIAGKREYIVRAIRPFADLINAGLEFDRTTYVTRRVVSGDLAHDVGYFHSVLSRPGAEPVQIVQKFSLVFMKERGEWKIITYFDAGTAPAEVLQGLEARYVID